MGVALELLAEGVDALAVLPFLVEGEGLLGG